MSPALSFPELNVNVARAKAELDAARESGDELQAALAEDRLNAALDALSQAVADRKAARQVSTPPNGKTALTSSGGETT